MDTSSPEWLRQCLVRAVLSMRDKRGSDHARAWLDDYERKHAGDTLRIEVVEQWSLGNRGAEGDWRTT